MRDPRWQQNERPPGGAASADTAAQGRLAPPLIVVAGISYHQLRPTDWRRLKSVRLQALRESEKYFGKTCEQEKRLDRSVWRERLRDSTWILAEREGEPVGIAQMLIAHDQPGVRFVESVWVLPKERNMGVARLMIDLLSDEAHHQGAEQLHLWVFDNNRVARSAYENMGFTFDHAQLFRITEYGAVYEQLMVRAISPMRESTQSDSYLLVHSG